MTVLEIITGKDEKILRKVCEEVKVFDEKLEKLVSDMTDTMLGDQNGNVTGIGLAAPQVGVDARVMLVTLNVNTKKDHRVVVMINPEITWQSENLVIMEEGCLSLPKVFGDVKRPQKIKARWQNVAGNWCERKFDGWDARILLHELDHLNGVLFIDKLFSRGD